jgi:glycosyltransferase involved in cell wall biosynthesis
LKFWSLNPPSPTLRILLTTTVFPPQIGGIETVSSLIAKELASMGHHLRVLTLTSGETATPNFCPVHRQPGLLRLLGAYAWADVVILMGETLRLGWPLLLLRKPAALVHHLVYKNPRGARRSLEKLRARLRNRCVNLAPSAAVAESIGCPARIVGNPYDDSVFRLYPNVKRKSDLVFLGRLVPEKGPDLLVDALELLAAGGKYPQTTIVGSGPLDFVLKRRVADLGLARSVRFVGPLVGESLALELNRHRVIVVPSRGREAFGIAALEAIACGCVAIGSNNGGLPEAIGPCGITFSNGDLTALATRIDEMIGHPNPLPPYCTAAPSHLRKYRPAAVATRYLELLRRFLLRAKGNGNCETWSLNPQLSTPPVNPNPQLPRRCLVLPEV